MLIISISLFVINSIIVFLSNKALILNSWSNYEFRKIYILTICFGLALLSILFMLKWYLLITIIYSFELLIKLLLKFLIKSSCQKEESNS